MPLFLIPIAAGAYMYYEKRKRDLEEQQNSGESCHETKTTAPISQRQSLSNECAEEVIETQLSIRKTNKENICITERVEITYDAKIVSDRRECKASTNDRAAPTNEKRTELYSATTGATLATKMIKLKRKRFKTSLSSFKNFLREQNCASAGQSIAT